MSYNSKYTGTQVEDLLDQVANGNVGGGGGITSETDPIFSASPAAGITDDNISSWNNKVDKVDGKQLSTEDFTTLLKQKLDGLSNYDDTAIQASVSKLRTDLDTLVSGDTTTAIKTFNEVIAFLDGLEDTEDLASIIASIEQQIAAKGTVTSITAGDGLEGGTITGEGTISLPVLGAISESGNGVANGSINTTYFRSSYNSGTVVIGITTDKFGRVTNVQTGTVYNTFPTGFAQLFAGGTAVTLNGSSKGGSSASFYAPTSAGTSGYVLQSKGSGAPSWTSIKTINGTSILGSGNIVIEGGSGGSSSGGAYAEVNHGTSDTTFTLTPNTFHVWDEVATLDLSFGAETSGVANEYLFQFTSGAVATTLTLPSDIKWANDTAPTISENMIYQISVLKGLASVLEFNAPLQLVDNLITVELSGMKINATAQYPVTSDIVISTNCGSVTITTGNTSGTNPIDTPEPTLSVLQIIPSSDNTYTYTY